MTVFCYTVDEYGHSSSGQSHSNIKASVKIMRGHSNLVYNRLTAMPQQKLPKFGFCTHTTALWSMEQSSILSAKLDCPVARQNFTFSYCAWNLMKLSCSLTKPCSFKSKINKWIKRRNGGQWNQVTLPLTHWVHTAAWHFQRENENVYVLIREQSGAEDIIFHPYIKSIPNIKSLLFLSV